MEYRRNSHEVVRQVLDEKDFSFRQWKLLNLMKLVVVVVVVVSGSNRQNFSTIVSGVSL